MYISTQGAFSSLSFHTGNTRKKKKRKKKEFTLLAEPGSDLCVSPYRPLDSLIRPGGHAPDDQVRREGPHRLVGAGAHHGQGCQHDISRKGLRVALGIEILPKSKALESAGEKVPRGDRAEVDVVPRDAKNSTRVGEGEMVGKKWAEMEQM